MSILFAYFDESGKKSDNSKVVAFAGMCSSEKQIKSFDENWNNLLRSYGWPALHMNELMHRKKFSNRIAADTMSDKVKALMPFADCINEYLEFGFLVAMDVNGFNNLKKGMRAGLGNPKDPNYVAFMLSMMELVKYCKPDDRVSVVCDHDDETASGFYGYYKGMRRQHEPIRKLTCSISFADDNYFPALQAADMVAYLARLEGKRRWRGNRHDYKPLMDYMIDKRARGKRMQWGVVFADELSLTSLRSNADILAEREQLRN